MFIIVSNRKPILGESLPYKWEILNSEEVVNPLPFCVTETVRSDYDMKELKVCSVSDKYIGFLWEDFPNVYSNKLGDKEKAKADMGKSIDLEPSNQFRRKEYEKVFGIL